MPRNQERTVRKWSWWWKMANGLVWAPYNSSKMSELTVNLILLLWPGWHKLTRLPLTAEQGNPKMGTLHFVWSQLPLQNNFSFHFLGWTFSTPHQLSGFLHPTLHLLHALSHVFLHTLFYAFCFFPLCANILLAPPYPSHILRAHLSSHPLRYFILAYI